MDNSSIGRRDFLAATGMGLAGSAVVAGAASPVGFTQGIRCGFVGVGGRGTALLKATLEIDGVDVVAICDIDKVNRARACELVQKVRGNKPAEFEEWTRLLADKEVAAVISALPCDLHYPMYRDTLAAGRHLYGEKPMCLTVAHCDALVKQSQSAGTVFQIGFQRRFSEPLRSAIGMFQTGMIGQPFEGRGVRFGSGGPHRKPGEWFSFRARSGDWMLEQAVHNFDVFNWALGELPISAFGSGRQDLFKEWDPKRDVSDYYSAILQYKSGLTLTWTHTWAAPPHAPFSGAHEQLIGPRGAIDLTKGFVAFRKDAVANGQATQQLEGEDRRDSTHFALRGFFDCVRSNNPAVVGAKEGREATLVGLLVRRAVYDRRLVTMDEILGTSA